MLRSAIDEGAVRRQGAGADPGEGSSGLASGGPRRVAADPAPALSRRRFLRASGLIAAAAALGGGANLGSIGRALAAAAWGSVLATFDGQPIHYNGADPSYAAGDSGYGPRWQALELVQRYCHAKQWTSSKKWPGVARPYQAFDAATAPIGFARHANGGATAPVPGDTLVFAKTTAWPTGHVALVSGVSATKITFVQQNVGTAAKASLPSAHSATGYRIDAGTKYPPVRGWLHHVAPGGYPAPLGERAVFTYYFYWYDTQTGTHVRAPDVLTDHPPATPTITFRGTAWHRKQIEDALYAGVDVLLPVYWVGGEHRFWAEPGVVNLARALEEVRLSGRTPPAVGMFYDTNSLQGLDLRTTAARDTHYAGVRFFFRAVPKRYWAKADGDRPVIWYYFSLPLGGYDSGFLADLSARFEAEFGVRPYIVLERDWVVRQPDLVGWDSTDAFGGVPTTFSARVADVGPGYDDRALVGHLPGYTGRVIDREDGELYRRGLTEAVLSGAPWLAIDTWNELHEATDVAETVEYGRQYLDITHEYSAYFKAGSLPAGRRIETPYADSTSVSTVLGASDVSRGLTLVPSTRDDESLHVPVVEAGQAGRRTVFVAPDAPEAYLYFHVDDGFYFNVPVPIRIDVTYFDEGFEPIRLDYDAAPAASDWNADTMYRLVDLAVRADTRQWKTANVTLRDARFCGHENLASDFRLTTFDGHPLTVSTVVVTKLG